MASFEPEHVDALLFDLGGVVFDFDFTEAFTSVAAATGLDAATVAQRFEVDDRYEAFERGEMSAEHYWQHLRELLGLDLADQHLAAAWNSIFGDLVAGIDSVLPRAAAARPIWALSNTNAAHVETFQARFGEALSVFEDVFASNEIGHRKPEAAAYLAAAQRMGVAPERVLFFDDLEVNVRGAMAVGMQGIVVTETADISRAVEVLGAANRPSLS